MNYLYRIAARVANIVRYAFSPAEGEMLTKEFASAIKSSCGSDFLRLEDLPYAHRSQLEELENDPYVKKKHSVRGHAGDTISFSMASGKLIDRGYIGMINFSFSIPDYNISALAKAAKASGADPAMYSDALLFNAHVTYYHKRGRVQGVVPYKDIDVSEYLDTGIITVNGLGQVMSIDLPDRFCSKVSGYIDALIDLKITPKGRKDLSDLDPSNSLENWIVKIKNALESNGLIEVDWSNYRPAMIVYLSRLKDPTSGEIFRATEKFIRMLNNLSLAIEFGPNKGLKRLKVNFDPSVDPIPSRGEVQAAKANREQLLQEIEREKKARLRALEQLVAEKSTPGAANAPGVSS